ncbi:MAG: COX15/CtaA family protein [Gammaproteobacteria bacterium]|nr:COX15/CtaA family protein [Gammaproteobacteria bacterium]MDH5778861.1 COX15/CtaA family protein [Gammaproteobacteria bacterium]
MNTKLFSRLALFASLLAVVVVLLGAYTRLADAGLGCPDWPGCYGHVGVPKHAEDVSAANQAFPERPVEAAKAWKEMIHRYFAGTLGLLVFALVIIALRNRSVPGQQVGVPVFLGFLIIFQALLGMWTVTIKLNPTIVMGHLMGGLATLSLLVWLSLRHSKLLSERRGEMVALNKLHMPALIVLIVVIMQIMLGGWTSANYAALACSDDFPTCLGQWWPATDFKEGFVLWRGTEMNFEFGVLNNDARAAIHLTHRIGAVITTLLVIWLALKLLAFEQAQVVNKLAILLMLVLLCQIGLGIANVVLSLPIGIAVAHNGVGAMLLLTLVMINHAIRPRGEMI